MKDYYWLNEDSRTFLQRGYLAEGQSAEQRIEEIALNAEKILKIEGFAKKFIGYMAKGFYSLSTPVWTNFGNKRGLPVSCFGSYISDEMESILSKGAEVGTMSKIGGGTSGFFGDLRPRGAKITAGGESSGPVHFMEIFETISNVVSQGSARRGSFAAYLPVDHPDVEEFLKIRSDGHTIQNTSIGITITNKWMEEMIGGDTEKRRVWGLIIKKRFESGYPYLFFTDTANDNGPEVYKKTGRKINASNLCTEIFLNSSKDESFVCVLSSINLLHWFEIIETDAIETLILFLDAVDTEFVTKTEGIKFLEAAHNFAKNQRALGMGVLGWHSLLQSKSIAFESLEAKILNNQIWKEIRKQADAATMKAATLFGEPELMKGTGRRNVTTLAVAPTTSSSFILGQVSPSIEPLNGNIFTKDLAKGKFGFKNPYFEEVLIKYGKNEDDVWADIILHGGSVQHLDFLTEHEKNVFKTFGEISQKEIVIQAANRQRFIDQGQSLNLMVSHDTSPRDVSQLLIEGWKMGIKSFYYQRGSNPSQKLARDILSCASCEA